MNIQFWMVNKITYFKILVTKWPLCNPSSCRTFVNLL